VHLGPRSKNQVLGCQAGLKPATIRPGEEWNQIGLEAHPLMLAASKGRAALGLALGRDLPTQSSRPLRLI
jgi:hypothetical protein